MKRIGRRRSRRGVSPVLANMIMIAITVALGAAIWGFASSAAGAVITSYTSDTNTRINFLREKFVIANVAFDYPNTGEITIWVYNNGNITTEINTVFFGQSQSSMTPITVEPALEIPQRQLGSTVISASYSAGNTYYFKAVGRYGNTHTYSQGLA